MSSNQNRLASLELGLDGGLEIRLDALDDIGQALGFRNRIAGVARIMVLRILVVRIDLWRRGGIGAAPQHELLVAVFLADSLLVLALQRTVVTLVQAPAALNRNPQAIGFVKRVIRGVDGATQQGGEHDVRKDVLLLEQLATALGFLDALLGQRDIHPAGELIGLVPCALTMSEQY